MSDLICRECGKEMEYDWAPCPNCGWKIPGPWEEPEEEKNPAPRALLAKPHKWIQKTAWFLVVAALVGLLLWLFRLL